MDRLNVQAPSMGTWCGLLRGEERRDAQMPRVLLHSNASFGIATRIGHGRASGPAFENSRSLVYLANRPEHVVGVLETHLVGTSEVQALNHLRAAGWRPLSAAAAPSNDNDLGTSGGAVIMCKS